MCAYHLREIAFLLRNVQIIYIFSSNTGSLITNGILKVTFQWKTTGQIPNKLKKYMETEMFKQNLKKDRIKFN